MCLQIWWGPHPFHSFTKKNFRCRHMQVGSTVCSFFKKLYEIQKVSLSLRQGIPPIPWPPISSYSRHLNCPCDPMAHTPHTPYTLPHHIYPITTSPFFSHLLTFPPSQPDFQPPTPNHQLPTTTVPTGFPAANSQPPPSPPDFRRPTPNHAAWRIVDGRDWVIVSCDVMG